VRGTSFYISRSLQTDTRLNSRLYVLAAACIALAAPASAQDHAAHHAARSGWKELDTYHDLMAATWHPAKENDLKPARAKADSLSAAAKAWSESKAPAACDNKAIKDAIAAVVTGSTKVLHLVHGNAPDAELKAAMHDVHERFEVVEKGCKPEKSHH
jgi:hypothetical protein